MSLDRKSRQFDIYQEYKSFKLIEEPKLARALSRWALGIISLIVLVTFLPWTQNIRSNGQVTTFNPGDRPQTIHTTIAGRIEQWHVQEGDYVHKGDTIISLSEVKEKYFDPQMLERVQEQIGAKQEALAAYEKKALALQRQSVALHSGLGFSLEKARNKYQQAGMKVESDSIDYVAAQTDFEIAELQFKRQEKLYQQGLKSLTEYETRRLKLQDASAKLLSARNKFYTAKNELLNTEIELSSLRADYEEKISKAESDLNSTLAYINDLKSEISKQHNNYSNLQIRSSFYAILAPQNGYVIQALKSGIGETVIEGEPVASVVAADPDLAVALYVQPVDLPLVEKGRKVRLQFDGWPALAFSGWPNLSFGTFGGIVAVIDNVDSKGKYRILVVPDPQEEAWPEAIRLGSGVYGWALLNDVPIWYEIWRQLNGFPADYMGESAEAASSDKKEKSS